MQQALEVPDHDLNVSFEQELDPFHGDVRSYLQRSLATILASQLLVAHRCGLPRRLWLALPYRIEYSSEARFK